MAGVIEDPLAEQHEVHDLNRNTWGVPPYRAGHRRHYRRGYLRHHRPCGSKLCRSGRGHLVRHRGIGLSLCRPLLCGICRHDPGGRQRLHLYPSHHGPLHGLVHRLDLVLEYLAAGATVANGWSGYFSDFMKYLGYPIPTAWSSAPALCGDRTNCSTYSPHASALSAMAHIGTTGAYINLPAVALIGTGIAHPDCGRASLREFQQRDGGDQTVHCRPGDRRPGLPHVVAANHTPFIPANTGDPGAISDGAVCCAPRA